MKHEGDTYLWVEKQMFIDCCEGLCWFSKLVFVDFPLVTMISVAESG